METVNGVIDGSKIARRAHAFIVRYARVGTAVSSLSAYADAKTRDALAADRWNVIASYGSISTR